MLLDELPSDVVESVLLSLPSLADLRAATLSCKNLNQTFNDRRSLILGSVFVSQVTNPNFRSFNGVIVSRQPHARCGPKTPSETRQIAVSIISKCKNTPDDAALLHSTVWHTLMRRDSIRYFHLGWSEKLMSRLHAVGRYEDELQVAEQIWKHLTAPKKTTVTLEAGAKAFVGTLHKLYLKHDRPDDAIQVLKTAISLARQHHECEFVTDLVNCFRKLGRTEEAIAYEREQYLACLKEVSTQGVSRNAMTWARHLTREYILAQRPNDAIDLQKAIFNRCQNAPRSRDPANLAHLTGWARQTIQALKKAGRHEEAVQIKAQMFEMLLNPTLAGGTRGRHAPTSLLLGWSRELVHDYVALNHRDEALAVDKAVWERLMSFLHQSPRDRTKAFHIRNAAMALTESYKRVGETEKAKRTMSEYEMVAEIGGWRHLVERPTA